MPQPPPRPQPRPQPRPAPAARPRPLPPGADNSLPPLTISFYRRMKRNKIYPVTVGWQRFDRNRTGLKNVVVRMLTAGAQVAPAEQTLDIQPGAYATFYVTPLALGWLRAQRVEVLSQERKLLEIPLRSKVVGHKITLFLLFMAVFSPWFILTFFKDQHRPAGVVLEKFIADHVPELPEFVEKDYPDIRDALNDMRLNLMDAYDEACDLSQIHPLAFYTAMGFFTLALLRILLCRDKRKRQKSKPIPLPRMKTTTFFQPNP